MGLFDFVKQRFGRGGLAPEERASGGQEARLEQEQEAARKEGPDVHVEGFRGRPAHASEEAFVSRMGSAARGRPETDLGRFEQAAPRIDLAAKRALRSGVAEEQGEGEEEGKARGSSSPAPDFGRISGAGRSPGFGAARRSEAEAVQEGLSAEAAPEAPAQEAGAEKGLSAASVVQAAGRAARGEPAQEAAKGAAPTIDFAAKRALRSGSAMEQGSAMPDQSEIEARFEADFESRMAASAGKGAAPERQAEAGKAPEIDLAGKRALRKSAPERAASSGLEAGAAKGAAPEIDLAGKRALRESAQSQDKAPEIDLAGKRALRESGASTQAASAPEAAKGAAPAIDLAGKRAIREAGADQAGAERSNPLIERHMKMVEKARKAAAPYSLGQEQAVARAKEASAALSANAERRMAKEADKDRGEGRGC